METRRYMMSNRERRLFFALEAGSAVWPCRVLFCCGSREEALVRLAAMGMSVGEKTRTPPEFPWWVDSAELETWEIVEGGF